MGIKLLITTAISIALAEGAQHADVGDTVELDSKDEALALCRAGRALYLDKTQDITKGQLSAAKEDLDRVKREAALIATARKAREAEASGVTPAVQAMIDAAVKAALGKATA